MKLPNKIITYKESILSKFPIVLGYLESNNYKVIELYDVVADKVEDVAEFLDILNCLFAFGKIKYNEENGSLSYVI